MYKRYVMYSEEMGEEFRSQSLAEVYKEWRRLVADDKENHVKRSYWFAIIEEYDDEPGVQYMHEIKIYRRNNKVFWKPL